MLAVTVSYPKTPDSHFDFDYYLQQHIPMVRSVCEPFGLKDIVLWRGQAALDGSPAAFELIGTLLFESPAAIQAVLEQHGLEIMKDIPNFTTIRPAMQISESLPS